MSDFETFVVGELPHRPTMLTYELTSYDGDPNSGGAPAMVSGAPKGSFYLQNTGNILWKKNTSSAGSWELVGGGATGPTVSETDMTFPINYVTGTDPVAGTVFKTQAAIDAYLVAHGITAFKHIMACYDTLPDHVCHYITFNLADVVHRPRNPEPAASLAAFCFGPYPGHAGPTWHSNSYFLVTATALVRANMEVIAADQTATGSSLAGPYEFYIDCAGASYTPGALKGYYCSPSNNSSYFVIRDNTATRLYLTNFGGSAPVNGTTQIRVISLPCIIRNSYNDTAVAIDKTMIRVDNANPLMVLGLSGLKLDQYSQYQPAVQTFGPVRHDHWYVMWDSARLKNNGVNTYAPAFRIYQGYGGQFLSCSFRGRGLATAPAWDSTFMYGSSQNTVYGGRIGIISSYVGGIGGGASNFIFYGYGVTFQSSTYADSRSPLEIESGGWASSAPSAFRNIQATNALQFGNNCATPPRNIVGSASFAMLFEGCTNCVALNGYNNRISCYDGSGSGLINGSTPNTGYGFTCPSSDAGNNALNVMSTVAISGTAGEILTVNGVVTYAALRAMRLPSTQPAGNFLGGITVRDVATGITRGVATLTFALSGTTLSLKAPGDSVAGTPVNISAGGEFILKSNTTSKWVRVVVKADQLPPGNEAQTFHIDFGRFIATNVILGQVGT